MAPEQLEGKEADARTDIFAFGAVVYEMVTGKKAFEGKSQASLISSIMSFEPAPISSIQPMSPAGLDRVVNICLAKDPEDRWQSAHDLASELRWIQEAGSGAGWGAVRTKKWTPLSQRIAWAAAGLFLLTSLALTFAYFRGSAPSRARPVRLQMVAPANTAFADSVAVSPDGNWLAFTATDPDGNSSLWVRSLDSLVARSLPGTEGARQPFWSPDSRALGFFAGGKLKRTELSAGTPQILAEASGDPRGGTWGRDGTIVFAPSFQGSLLRIAATGGEVSPAIALDSIRKEQTHRWPSFLPDGRHFLYYASRGGGEEPGEIFVGSLDQQPPRRVVESSSLAMFAAPGYLLFVRGKTLLAQPFDVDRLRLNGRPVAIADQLSSSGSTAGLRTFSVSSSGVLAYHVGSGSTDPACLARPGRQRARRARSTGGSLRAPPLSRRNAAGGEPTGSGQRHEWRHLADGPCPEHRVAIHVRSGGRRSAGVVTGRNTPVLLVEPGRRDSSSIRLSPTGQAVKSRCFGPAHGRLRTTFLRMDNF